MKEGERSTIFIVEDDRSISELIEKTLAEQGLKTVCYYSGKELLNQIQRKNNSLLLIDYNLPDGKALHFIRKLAEKGINPPFIVMTAAGNEEAAVEAIREGAADYIIKNSGFYKILPALLHRLIKKEKTETEARIRNKLYGQLQNAITEAVIVVRNDAKASVCDWNRAAEDLLGWHAEEMLGNPMATICSDFESLQSNSNAANKDEGRQRAIIKGKDNREVEVELNFICQYDELDELHSWLIICRPYEVEQNKEQSTDDSYSQVDKEDLWVTLTVVSSIIEIGDFEQSAAIVHRAAKKLIGAKAGYIALLSDSGEENDVVYLDPGEYDCNVDPSIPMPVHGLRAVAYKTGKVVYDNDFANSPHWKFMPKGHVILDNVLFAPLILNGEPVGLMGLSNKPGGFTDKDCITATMFARYASLALYNSKLISQCNENIEKYKLIVENTSDAIWTMDSNGKFLHLSPSIFNLTGFYPDELYNSDLSKIVCDNSLGIIYQGLQNNKQSSLRGEPLKGGTFNIDQHHKDGRIIHTEASVNPVYDEKGSLKFYLGVSRDISEKVRIEEEIRTLNRMLKSKNKELEQIVYITSHDFRSPLVNIDGFIKQIEKQLQKIEFAIQDEDEAALKNDCLPVLKDRFPEYFKYIKASTNKMDDLIKAMLQFSRLGRSVPRIEPLNMNDLITKVTSLFEYKLNANGFVVIKDDLLPCSADATLLNQLFSNLFDNAIKYRKPEGDHIIRISSSIEGLELKYSFEDNGIGISDELSSTVFDLFFQENKASSGEGMGLTQARKIMDLHNGRIELESQKGIMTRFTIFLPVLAKSLLL